jgi:hypothetical protein
MPALQLSTLVALPRHIGVSPRRSGETQGANG